eukprot:gnl/MRDRNA2_/MRDRNA2_67418_c0_seq2.p1 gnl/MRDRNA2_/MRDRNA2_67418_c0~~gnl/MRDRNA2_/MRDRNA2_67418_c0_seq2.p1  ORF type:complete len:667 (+),score=121.14 gnl/MRDRNA2_/MRDRNA2_67418_c0_seq2:99-2099(+)
MAPQKILVKSQFANLAGIYELRDEDDGKPIYENPAEGTWLWSKDGTWMVGSKPGGNSFFCQAEGGADPTRIRSGAFGEAIDEITELPGTDRAALEACPQLLGLESKFGNIDGVYKRIDDFQGFPAYYNKEDNKYLWQKVMTSEWMITDGKPGTNCGSYVKWACTDLDPSHLVNEEGKIYSITWDVNDRSRQSGFNNSFKDHEFPPNENSLGVIMDDAEWISCTDLSREATAVVFDTIEPNDLMQGSLGDCWLLAAMASVAEFPHKVEALFGNGNAVPRDGKFIIKLYKVAESAWDTMVVDSYIPCKKRSWYEKMAKPLFTRPHGNELWCLLLEKAFAKYVGSYQNLDGGQTAWAWQAMTGCETCYMYSKKADGTWDKCHNGVDQQRKEMQSGKIRALPMYKSNQSYTADEFFELLLSNDEQNHLMSTSISGAGSDTDKREDGLVEGHAFSFISAFQQGDIRLVRLRNPWGNDREWNGAWSDGSPEWKNYPELAAKLRPQRRNSIRGMNDGLFWMSFEDYSNHFNTVYHLPQDMSVGAVGPSRASAGAVGPSTASARVTINAVGAVGARSSDNSDACLKLRSSGNSDAYLKLPDVHATLEDKIGIQNAFRRWDKVGDGRIAEKQLKQLITALNPELVEADLIEILGCLDKDREKRIAFNDFINWFWD